MKQNDRLSLEKKVIAPAGHKNTYSILFTKAQGSRLYDEDGNSYVDMASSACCVNAGHNHPKVVAAIQEQASHMVHCAQVYAHYPQVATLGDKLINLAPGDFDKLVTFSMTGSAANDSILKYARAYTGRWRALSFMGAYHGSTYGSLSLSAISPAMKRHLGPLVPGVHYLEYPTCYRCPYDKEPDTCGLNCLNRLKTDFDRWLPADEVAVCLIEPIGGDMGIYVPPTRYMAELYELLKHHGILFAVDEVQQSMGRTGTFFGIQQHGIAPDLISMGKSLASGMPLTATIGRAEIMNTLYFPAHAFSTNANPICCAAAIATIDAILEDNLMERAQTVGNAFRDQLAKLVDEYECVGDVRGIGFTIGIDIVTDKASKTPDPVKAALLCSYALQHNFYLLTLEDHVLRVQPPLMTAQEDLDRFVSMLRDALDHLERGQLTLDPRAES